MLVIAQSFYYASVITQLLLIFSVSIKGRDASSAATYPIS